MNTSAVKPQDLVLCNKLGRVFHSRVLANDAGELAVKPLTRNVSYHTVRSREVTVHYALRPPARGKVSTAVIRPEDIVAYATDAGESLATVTRKAGQWLTVVGLHRGAEPQRVLTRCVRAHYARRGRKRR